MWVVLNKLFPQIKLKFSRLPQDIVNGGFFNEWSLQFELHCGLVPSGRQFLLACIVLYVLNMFETSHEALDQEFAEFSILNLSIVRLFGEAHDEVDIASVRLNALPEEDGEDAPELLLSANTCVLHIIDAECLLCRDAVIPLQTLEHVAQNGLRVRKFLLLDNPSRPDFVL